MAPNTDHLADSLSRRIREAVKAAPQPLSSAEIRAAVKDAPFKQDNIHFVICQMARDGQLETVRKVRPYTYKFGREPKRVIYNVAGRKVRDAAQAQKQRDMRGAKRAERVTKPAPVAKPRVRAPRLDLTSRTPGIRPESQKPLQPTPNEMLMAKADKGALPSVEAWLRNPKNQIKRLEPWETSQPLKKDREMARQQKKGQVA